MDTVQEGVTYTDDQELELIKVSCTCGADIVGVVLPGKAEAAVDLFDAHHRGQQTALLRMLGRELHSTYGPTADTGGLMQSRAPTIYAYRDLDALLEDAAASRARARLPGPGDVPVSERPDR